MSIAPFELLTRGDTSKLTHWLTDLGVLDDGETIQSVSPAGEGNMNLVLRARTSGRSMIVKQSRPWVEKYPNIAAPANRIHAEIDFYHAISRHADVQAAVPRIFAADRAKHLLVLEDLGEASDYSFLYGGDSPAPAFPLEPAIGWLSQLHGVDTQVDIGGAYVDQEAGGFGNLALRQLNHAHVFAIPFQSPSAIDLDHVCPGLERVADSVRGDDGVVAIARRLGQRYLETGGVLLHGDYYPGSWLDTPGGFRVIDPEFCFLGPAEFDVAVLSAHLLLTGAREKLAGAVTEVVQRYRAHATQRALDWALVAGWSSVEVIRRLVGVAQLPVSDDVVVRAAWLEQAKALLCESANTP